MEFLLVCSDAPGQTLFDREWKKLRSRRLAGITVHRSLVPVVLPGYHPPEDCNLCGPNATKAALAIICRGVTLLEALRRQGRAEVLTRLRQWITWPDVKLSSADDEQPYDQP